MQAYMVCIMCYRFISEIKKPFYCVISCRFISFKLFCDVIYFFYCGSNSRFLLKAHGYQAYEQDKKICNRTIERLFLIPDSRFKRLQSWPNPFKKIVHT